MRAKALIEKKGADLTREDAARHLGAHLCRCTGYVKILDAIELLAQGEDGRGAPRAAASARAASRYQGLELALGDKPYVDDLRVPGCCTARSASPTTPAPTSSRIDHVPRPAVPGVVAVFTAADVPGELRVGLIHKDWPVFIPEGGRTSYLGDVLAIVVAEDRADRARAAAELVDVDYDVLAPDHRPGRRDRPIADDAVWGTRRQRALALGVRAGRRRRRARGERARGARGVPDPAHRARVPRARVDARRARRAATARLHVYSGGQGVWDDRDQIASVLGIDAERVTVELVSNGGAFGGKEDMANQAQTALAAWLLGGR